jgi:hypothetical protein
MLMAALLFGDGAQVFLITLTMVGGALLAWKLLGPLAQALARRLEGRIAGDPRTADELTELQARVQELEAQQGRVLELEERVDFAERLLAQQRPESGRVGPGGER